MNSDRFEPARKARGLHSPALLRRPDVNAVSVGMRQINGVETDEPCVTIWVDRKLPPSELSPARLLPANLAVAGSGVHLDVRESTRLMAPAPSAPPPSAAAQPETRVKLRPVPSGASGASFRFTVGTLTCVVSDVQNSAQRFVLSCNHVLADVNLGQVGDAALQPAFSDGGTMTDSIGGLARWMPIRFGNAATNLIDAALAAVAPETCIPDAIGIGPITGVRAAETILPGETVSKVGRTSGVTQETVLGIDADIWVTYLAAGRLMRALYAQQILTTPCSAYGDSGSPLIDSNGKIAGMLFSGTGTTTAFNSFSNILTLLNVRFT